MEHTLRSFCDLPNGQIKSRKIGLGGLLVKKLDVIVIVWTLIMQECSMSISLH
jgi:hypothetical protein